MKKTKNITLPDSIINIGNYAFTDCESISGIVIPDSVTHIGFGTFCNCENLANEDGFVIVNNIMYDYWGDVESIIIPDGVTAIEDSVFPNDIINITIPESVTNINSSDLNPCGKNLQFTQKLAAMSKFMQKKRTYLLLLYKFILKKEAV